MTVRDSFIDARIRSCPLLSFKASSLNDRADFLDSPSSSPVSYITDIKILTSKTDLPQGYTIASGDDLHSGVYPTLPPLWLAYKTQSSQSLDEMDDWAVVREAEEEEILTEIDVLFGDGEVRIFTSHSYDARIMKADRCPIPYESVAMVRLLPNHSKCSRSRQETSRTRLPRRPQRQPPTSSHTRTTLLIKWDVQNHAGRRPSLLCRERVGFPNPIRLFLSHLMSLHFS